MRTTIISSVLIVLASYCQGQAKISKDVVSNGATRAENSQVMIQATLGQSIIGTTASSNNSLEQGFWALAFQNSTSVHQISDQYINEFKVSDPYPNPSNGTFNLRLESDRSRKVQLSLFDPMGKLIGIPVTKEIHSGISEIRLDLDFLSVSNYYLKITDGKYTVSKILHIL